MTMTWCKHDRFNHVYCPECDVERLEKRVSELEQQRKPKSELKVDIRLVGKDILLSLMGIVVEVVGDQRIPEPVRVEYHNRLVVIRNALNDGLAVPISPDSKLHDGLARMMGVGDQYEEVE